METGGRLERRNQGAGHEATELQKGCAGDSPGGRAGQGSRDGCSHPAAQGQEAVAPRLHFPWRGGQGADAGALPPTWGHVWGSGGPCAGLSHPSRGRTPLGDLPGLGSVAARQRRSRSAPRHGGHARGRKGSPWGRGRSGGRIAAAGLREQCTAVLWMTGTAGSQLRPDETRNLTPSLNLQWQRVWYPRHKRKKSPRDTTKKEREGQEGCPDAWPRPACPCGSCCSLGCCCQVGLRGPQGLKP